MEQKGPIEYKIELPFGEARLDILLFSDVEHRWIFTHNYARRNPESRRSPPIVTNKTCLIVNYNEGQASDIELSMEIKRPDKMGQAYWLGMDISPGAHVFVEFEYERQKELFRMKTIRAGASSRLDLDALAKSQMPMKPFQFPFPLKDRVELEFKGYRVPYLANDGSEHDFVFPETYRWG